MSVTGGRCVWPTTLLSASLAGLERQLAGGRELPSTQGSKGLVNTSILIQLVVVWLTLGASLTGRELVLMRTALDTP